MTKKDYELISQSIWRSGYIKDKNKVRQQAREKIRRLIAIDLASSLSNENPHFDKSKFYEACGVEVEEDKGRYNGYTFYRGVANYDELQAVLKKTGELPDCESFREYNESDDKLIKGAGYIAEETFVFSKQEWLDLPKTLRDCLDEVKGQNKPLLCVHKGCKKLQTADGEYCEKHYPSIKHKLIVKSYHDVIADCPCGWHYVFTGAMSHELIKEQYDKHLQNKIVSNL